MASWSMQPFGHNTWAKIGGAVPPLLFFGGGERGPHLTQCRLAEVYLCTKWQFNLSSHLATTDIGRKLGLCPFWGGELGPHVTQWCFILVHPTVWSQYTNVTDRTDRQGEPFYKRSLKNWGFYFYIYICNCMYVSFGQGSSLLWTHTLSPFYSRPIALTQEGRNVVNDVCECVRD